LDINEFRRVDEFSEIDSGTADDFGHVWLCICHRLHSIMDRHSSFLDHLEHEMFSSESPANFLTEWQKFKATGHQGRPLSVTFYLVWAGLLVGALAVGFWLEHGISNLVGPPHSN
jgi:hypothetical protein